jgi:hypothetical protein
VRGIIGERFTSKGPGMNRTIVIEYVIAAALLIGSFVAGTVGAVRYWLA